MLGLYENNIFIVQARPYNLVAKADIRITCKTWLFQVKLSGEYTCLIQEVKGYIL